MVDTDYSQLNVTRTIEASKTQDIEALLEGLGVLLSDTPELQGYLRMAEHYEHQLATALDEGTIDMKLLKEIEAFAESALGSSLIKDNPSLKGVFDDLMKEADDLFAELLFMKGDSSQLVDDLYGTNYDKFDQALLVMFFMLDRAELLYDINQQKMDELTALQKEMDYVNKVLGDAQANEKKKDSDAKNVPQYMLDLMDKYDVRPDGMKTKDLKDEHWQIVIKVFERLQQKLMNDSQELMTEMKLSADDVKVAFDTAKNYLETEHHMKKDAVK